MVVEVLTKNDLNAIENQLKEIKAILLSQQPRVVNNAVEGYKTKDVRRILKCSVNKLVSLRVGRKLRWKKIGGTIYYNRDDVRRLVDEGF